MSLYDERIYVNTLSSQLENFKEVRHNLFNARCPVCGDSQKNKKKSRFYVYPDKEGGDFFRVKCHNCTEVGGRFLYFLKEYYPSVYDQYLFEKYKGNYNKTPEKKLYKENLGSRESFDIESETTKISSLDSSHPARQLLEGRHIPSVFFKELFYTDDFWKLAETFNPTRYPRSSTKKEARIILPLWSRGRMLLGFQGRDITGKSDAKYITIKESDEVEKIWGLHRYSPSKPGAVFEGAFDAMFIENSVAMTGLSVSSKFIQDAPKSIIITLDNQPRHRDVLAQMKSFGDRGFKVTIWGDRFHGKDVNEMIINGYDAYDIQQHILNNSFSGLRFKNEFQKWKKL